MGDFPLFINVTNEEIIMRESEIHDIPEATGVFVDSIVCDTFNRLVFASLWGHTAAIQNTIARITSGDVTEITINGTVINVDKEMLKKVGKLPKSNDYGDMTHCFIYRKSTHVEQAGKREIIFVNKQSDEQIFSVVKSMSILPLLDKWKTHLLHKLREKEMLIDLKTICGKVYGIHINLGNEDEYSAMISAMLQTKQLTV